MEKKDKHGAPLVIGFAEFDNAHQANAALKTIQVAACSIVDSLFHKFSLTFHALHF